MSFADPLWEFVLEDYEEEETGLRKLLGNRKKKEDSQRDKDKSSWTLDLFDGRDDNNASTRKQYKNAIALHRSRSIETKSSNGSRSFRKGRRSEYRHDEDSFWDIISGAPPAATIRKKPLKKSARSKNAKTRHLPPKKSTPESSRNPVVKKSSSKGSIHSSTKSDVSDSDKKKRTMKQRFKWQNSKSPQKSSMDEYGARQLDIKHASLKKAPAGANHDAEDSEFNPVDMFFQIADSLDPWGLDTMELSSFENDSIDEDDDEEDENLINEGGRYAGSSHISRQQKESTEGLSASGRSPVRARSDKSNAKTRSLLDQPLPQCLQVGSNHSPREQSGVSTEIRLRVNSGGNTLSEQVYETTDNGYDPRVEEKQISLDLEEDKSFASRPSFDDDSESSTESSETSRSDQISEGGSNGQNRAIDEDKTNGSTETTVQSSGGVDIPAYLQATGNFESRDDITGGDIERTSNRDIWKQAVCSFRKTERHDLLNRSRKLEAFPTSRVVIDEKTHSIVGPESNLMNGLVGVPSNNLVESKGPQSVFAYDYESNEHMDVSYSKPNQKPQSSIFVRNLGRPSSLLPSVSAGEKVVIQVEASTVSETDCIIRQGLWWRPRRPSLPNTPGIDLVGKVYSMNKTTAKAYKLKHMQSVLSLVKWGGNTRFMAMDPNQLVKVPGGLDPAEVACLPETYLSAFQVLHMGQTGKLRYHKHSLRGKSLLILGSMTNNMGKAMIELALQAGVANIYATAKKKHWKRLMSYGVMPLSTDPMEWIQRISGTIDLVLAPNGNLREDVTPVHFRALRPKFGQLIICGYRIVGNDMPINDWKRNHQAPTLVCGKSKALHQILSNSQSYDVYEEWDTNLELCKRDLGHLLTLLESKAIQPEVLDRIPLDKVAKAQELLEMKRLPGFLVCEPWLKSKKRAVYL